MASCTSAGLAGVVTVAISLNVAVMAVCAAWEDIAEGVVCASLCVEASKKSVFLSLAVLRAKIFDEHSWPCTFWNYGPPSLKRALSLLADSHSRARHRLTGHVVVSWCEGR